MKKRIISLILLVAVVVCSLASCAYSYDKDDMSQYVDFNKDAFIAGLKTLKIEDADFGIDEALRDQKVQDAINASLAGTLGDDAEHKTEGKPAAGDLLYYAYYATFEKDSKTVTVYASSMKESSAVKLQLSLTTEKELDKAISDKALEEGFTLTDYAYNTATDAKAVAGGSTVVVTYTRTYKTTDGGEQKTTYTNAIVTLPAATTGAEGAPATFLEYLIGQDAAKDLATKKFTEDVDGTATEVTYSGIRINWLVESDINDNFTVKHTPFDTKKEVKAVDGSTVDLKDVELTYHIFPVYYIETPELTAEIILDKLLGTSIKAGGDANEDGKVEESEEGTLPVFTDSYKNGDETINALVTKLVELLNTRKTAESAETDAQKKYDDAKKAVDDAKGNPTADQENALQTTETALNKAKDEHTKAKKDVADQIAKILAATKEGGEDIKKVIADQYVEYRYESLENTYKSAIKKSLASAIYELAQKNITYKKDGDKYVLPTQAVNEAYDRLINNYEYDFYEGTYSSSSSSSTTAKKTNYEQYGGKFIDFLRDELSMKTTDSDDAVYAAIRADAEDAVMDTILIYTLKTACTDKDVSVTEDDVKTFKKGIQYLLLQYQIGEDNIKESYYMPALQLDNIFNYFLEEDENNEDNKVKYVRLEYEFKAEEEEKDGE